MPINTDLIKSDPYYDDFDFKKQYQRILFKPAYAVQARELTQLQTILQNQIEQFGDNIFQEGSIVKGCNFTQLNELQYVKVVDKSGFDPTAYIGGNNIDGSVTQYELENTDGLKAQIVYASIGFETKNPDLNTFYIVYLNSTPNVTETFTKGQTFTNGQLLTIKKYIVTDNTKTLVPEASATINVSGRSGMTGSSYGLKVAEGVIFQKGHFLYVSPQTIIVSKYMAPAEDGSVAPHNVSVGFKVVENIKSALDDSSLYDNSSNSPNENAPGADRLQLVPVLTGLSTAVANADPSFFTLVRYSNGKPVQVRDVSQYNVIGQEFARRTFEESGNYIVDNFKVKAVDRLNANNDTSVWAAVGSGTAYVKGFRVESKGEVYIPIDPIANTDITTQTSQSISLNYGGYLDTYANGGYSGKITYSGDYNTYASANLVNSSNTIIGTTRIKNISQDRIYIFDSRLTNTHIFSEVDTIHGPQGYIKVDSIMKQTSNDIAIYDTGVVGIKRMYDIVLPVRVSSAASVISSNTITLTITGGADEDFNVQENDIVVIDANSKNLVINSVVKSINDTTLTIHLQNGQSPSDTVTVYYNKRYKNAVPATKETVELYIQTAFTANTADTTKYSLGFPDVYKIISIEDSTGKLFTDSFKLNTNQRNNYYDLSYIEYISGRPLPDTGTLLVKMSAFKVNVNGNKYFFTIGSYPNTISPNEFPIYTSSTGKTYSLRDSIDFRPHCNPAVTYASAAAQPGAVVDIDINTAPTFSAAYLVPALDSSASVSYERYLNRTDVITLDSYGNIAITKGKADIKSKAESIDGNRLVISEIYVPGYPALSPAQAAIQGKPEYAYRVKPTGVKGYTMKDIAQVETKIDRLMYYASVSMLEMSTQNMDVRDENGLSRFKNGIVVDPFNDLSIADLQNVEYSAGLDFTEKSLIPAVKTFPINLKLKSSNNASIYLPSSPEAATMASNGSDVSILHQPYATGFRNCVSNFYNYRGVGYLYPEYDGAHDVVADPPQDINIDLATPFMEFAQGLQEIMPLTSTDSTLLSADISSTTETNRSGFLGKNRNSTTTTTETDVYSDLTRTLQVLQGNVTTQNLGDFVTNFEFNPYMRARDINILMTGLRPNTKHYFYFDGQDVNEYIAPALVGPVVRDILKSGAMGTSVTSNANGAIAAVFSLPPTTFFVGDRKLVISDADNFDSISSAGTSGGIITYHAYNYTTHTAGITASTRHPDIDIDETTTLRTVTNRTVSTNTRIDPIAQTFFIKKSMGQGADTVFVSKLDLYFKRKPTTSGNGVTVMLREVNNGYPTIDVMPFSKIHLTVDEVNVNEDPKLQPATPITFRAPVRLDVEKEYCFVVMPDAADPDYLIYTSKVGGKDLISDDSVIQDWGDGVLFTSTNDRSWNSYQDEDIKFNLYRKNFATAPNATVTLTTDDNEFLSIDSNFGTFQHGEILYAKKDKATSTSANTGISKDVNGNDTNIITGTALTDTYSTGKYLLISGGGNKDIFKVIDSSNSTPDVILLDRPVHFDAGSYTTDPVTIGEIVYFNYRSPDTMVLERSSGSAGPSAFAAGDAITGLMSGATANIVSVDNPKLSYFQPMILRTTDSSTSVTMSGKFAKPGTEGQTTYIKTVPFNDKTVFNEEGIEIYSKSNIPVSVSERVFFELTLDMTNNGNVTTSPFVDIETAMMFAYQYKITKDSTTTAKYVSKVVELAENLDAEDFKLFVTGYRPTNTNIKAYIRVQSANDPTNFESNSWIPLDLVEGLGTYSATSNLNDFKEFVYVIPDANKTGPSVSYNNASGHYTGYRKFSIKIELLIEGADAHIGRVPRLLDYRGIALT